jgi:HNH endonuclease
MSKLCSIDGCNREHYGRGWCRLHWRRWSRHGDPMIMTRASAGEGTISHNGYRIICRKGVDYREHIEIVERVLGRKLPPEAEVHHVNGDPSDNRNENLVVCPSRAYHMLLHQRTDALKACGHADWRSCAFCKQYGDPQVMKFLNTGMAYHHSCRSEYRKRRRLLTGRSV